MACDYYTNTHAMRTKCETILFVDRPIVQIGKRNGILAISAK